MIKYVYVICIVCLFSLLLSACQHRAAAPDSSNDKAWSEQAAIEAQRGFDERGPWGRQR